MLPWKCNSFYAESKGFPSKTLMRFSLGADMIQALISALCSCTYIGISAAKGEKDPTTSPNARILFVLNIAISFVTIVLGILLLYMKDRLLKKKVFRENDKVTRSRDSLDIQVGMIYGGNSSMDTLTQFNNPILSDISTELSELQSKYDAVVSENKILHERINIECTERAKT